MFLYDIVDPLRLCVLFVLLFGLLLVACFILAWLWYLRMLFPRLPLPLLSLPLHRLMSPLLQALPLLLVSQNLLLLLRFVPLEMLLFAWIVFVCLSLPSLPLHDDMPLVWPCALDVDVAPFPWRTRSSTLLEGLGLFGLVRLVHVHHC